MADNLRKAPKKGILKSSSSFEKTEPYRCNSKEMKWDEMNILQTLHPADKDYGHMKIDEPKTPYANYKDPEDGSKGSVDPHSDDETDGLDADQLAKKIQLGSKTLPKALVVNEEDEDDDDDFDPDETEEERAKRKLFEQKRKMHYNEFYAVKLARKLMETGEEEEDEDDDQKLNEDDEEEPEDLSPVPSNSHTNEQASENGAFSTNVDVRLSPDAKDTANIEGD